MIFVKKLQKSFEKMVTDAGVDIEKTTQDVMMAFRNTYLGLPVEG